MASLYFMDTSALIVRFLNRAAGHIWTEALCRVMLGNTISIAEITEAELAAAMNQLVRGGILRPKRGSDALSLFWRQVDAGEYTIIPVSSSLVRRAGELCATYPLKGYDAIQLAACLLLRDDVRAADALNATHGGVLLGDPIFLTEDQRLAAAAAGEGFTVDSPAAHP